jgi:hypothetical protein
MTHKFGSLLDSLEHREAQNRGFYGSMVATQNYLATSGHIVDIEDVEFERLNGPTDTSFKWVDVPDMTYGMTLDGNFELDDLEMTSYLLRDIEEFELTPAQVRRLQLGMNVDASVTELVPHLVGRQAYFREVDAFRKRILACITLEALYEIIDETIQLDDYMITTVDGWKPVKTTFERLEPQLTKVETRIRERQSKIEQERIARETYLIKIGYIKKEEPIGV